MSNAHPFYTSASLKAADAQQFGTMQDLLHPSLLKGLDAMGFEYMTPVQSKVLTELRPLKRDCLVQAKTGTGKTIAFLLPAIQTLTKSFPRRGQVSILIISPTRELAVQIATEATTLLAQFEVPIEVQTAFGGTRREHMMNMFSKGDPKILVATPGRLKDYLSDENLRLRFQSLQTLILDEADRMLEAGFLPDILSIIQRLPAKDKTRWQGMCYSATFPNSIKEVLSNVLDKDYMTISTIDSSEPPTLARVEQNSIVIPSVKDTFNALYSLITSEISKEGGNPKILVFGSTTRMVALYAQLFQDQKRLKVYELHSRLTQAARTRTTSEFKDAECGILFATDVVGRGMDFPNVTLVVQVGIPSTSDAYTHRVGRTARAGKDGRGLILLTEAESYFLHANRKFPITTYPGSAKILQDNAAANKVSKAMELIDDDLKQRAYVAYLGYMKAYIKSLKIDGKGLVHMANELALQGMNLAEAPAVEPKLIG
ncbi:hypothetical protein MMC07_006890 [Pseudocyphellaria aurata]|nr:hypothetical protein [Pseudocyphellaria aurata]